MALAEGISGCQVGALARASPARLPPASNRSAARSVGSASLSARQWSRRSRLTVAALAAVYRPANPQGSCPLRARPPMPAERAWGFVGQSARPFFRQCRPKGRQDPFPQGVRLLRRGCSQGRRVCRQVLPSKLRNSTRCRQQSQAAGRPETASHREASDRHYKFDRPGHDHRGDGAGRPRQPAKGAPSECASPRIPAARRRLQWDRPCAPRFPWPAQIFRWRSALQSAQVCPDPEMSAGFSRTHDLPR